MSYLSDTASKMENVNERLGSGREAKIFSELNAEEAPMTISSVDFGKHATRCSMMSSSLHLTDPCRTFVAVDATRTRLLLF